MDLTAQCQFCGDNLELTHASRRYCSASCRRARWESENPEKVRAGPRNSRAKKPAYYAAMARAWYVANRERALESSRRWSRENRDLKTLHVAKRRARETSSVTADEWRRFLGNRPDRCTYCGRDGLPLTADHVVPLSRGGRHEPANLVWACRSCNSRKSARDALEYRAQLALEDLIRGRARGCSERRWVYRAGRAWARSSRGTLTSEVSIPRAIRMKIARSAKIPR